MHFKWRSVLQIITVPKIWLWVLVSIWASSIPMANAQPTIHIALLQDQSASGIFEKRVQEEIRTLLQDRYTLKFVPLSPAPDDTYAENLIKSVMADPALDYVIALSMGTSVSLGQLRAYPKPSISAIVLDRRLQGLPMTAQGTSGIANFTFVESPFDIAKDLKTFAKLSDFHHLGVPILSQHLPKFPDIYSFLTRTLNTMGSSARFTFIDVDPENIEETLDGISPEVDAVYLTPAFMDSSEAAEKAFIAGLNARKLPTFAMLGEETVQRGAMAAIAPSTNLDVISRRIAIDLMKMVEGTDAAELSVEITTYNDNFVVNLATLRQIGFYPRWELLSHAKMINMGEGRGGRHTNLRAVIAEALKTNLDLQISRLDTQAQRQEVGVAKGTLLPQAEVSTSITRLDDNRADGQPGSPAPYSWIGSGQLSQVVFSDDLWANYTIQKLLVEAAQYQEEAQVLDTVITATEGYITLLVANSNLEILNDNLNVTRQNLDISRSKEAVGYGGASDVYRWESELAQNTISVNDAYRDVRRAELNLNQILDHPLEEPFQVEDLNIEKSIHLMITDPRIYTFIENYKNLQDFSKFLVQEADRNLPELKQVAATIRSQQRSVINRRRAFYLPEIQLGGSIDKTIEQYDTDYPTPGNLDHPWSISATASLPIFTGGQRRYALKREQLELARSRLEERNLINQLRLLVHSNLETAAVSAREIDISRQSLEAASKNFDIVQDAYRQGERSVTDLVDAQNSKVRAEQGVAVAKYQFILDFLILERSQGKFHFLSSPEEKEAFYQRLAGALSEGE